MIVRKSVTIVQVLREYDEDEGENRSKYLVETPEDEEFEVPHANLTFDSI